MATKKTNQVYRQVRSIFDEIRKEAEDTGRYFFDILEGIKDRADVRRHQPVLDAITARCIVENKPYWQVMRNGLVGLYR